jgi:predicted Fe-Mo cluster-binding NifX family protein
VKIVVTATGNDLDASTNPRFGRCPTYIFVETESMAFEAKPNPAASASGGAGIQAAQFVVEQGAQAVLSGNLGPNAMQVLNAAGVPVYLVGQSTVREAVEAFKAEELAATARANVQAHAGMGQNPGQIATSVISRRKEITDLRLKAADLRKQLADVVKRIEQLEKDN